MKKEDSLQASDLSIPFLYKTASDKLGSMVNNGGCYYV